MQDVDKILVRYAVDNLLSYEELHSFGSPERFYSWVKNTVVPVSEEDLEIGDKLYLCILVLEGGRVMSSRGKWDGKNFRFNSKMPDRVKECIPVIIGFEKF